MAHIFKIESTPDKVKEVRDAIRPLLENASFNEETVNNLLVALGEAVTNAIRHSYGNDPSGKIIVSLEDNSTGITFRIRDFGKKIDLSKIKEPVLPPDKPGGLGIYFMQTIMDEMRYNTEHTEGNELILSKFKDQGECREDSN